MFFAQLATNIFQYLNGFFTQQNAIVLSVQQTLCVTGKFFNALLLFNAKLALSL